MSKAPESKLLERARTPEDAAALAKFDEQIALPLVLAAILPLVLMPGKDDHTWLVAVVAIVSWLVFLLDFGVHERRLVGYLGTWWGRFDLTVVILTAPWFLFVDPGHTKFVLIVRLARLARIVMATSGARRLLERLGRVALVAGIVLVLGSALAYHAEHPTNPGFATFGDALWWGIVTLTTVGYGDIVPKTTEGRAAGVMIMITGIAILGLLAGSLASFFRLEPKANDGSGDTGSPAPGLPEPGGQPDSIAPDTIAPDSIALELARVPAELVRLAAEIATLRSSDDDR